MDKVVLLMRQGAEAGNGYCIALKPALFSLVHTTFAVMFGLMMLNELPILSEAGVIMPNPLSLISTILQPHILPAESTSSVGMAHTCLGLRLFSQDVSSRFLLKMDDKNPIYFSL
jgi:hypothetical protein